MKLNWTLIAVGILLLCAGLYRANPPKFGRMIFFLAPIGAMFAGMLFLLFKSGRMDVVPGTAKDLLALTGDYIPLLILLFGTMALGGQLVRNVYAAQAESFLANHGSIGALGIAMFTPSSS